MRSRNTPLPRESKKRRDRRLWRIAGQALDDNMMRSYSNIELYWGIEQRADILCINGGDVRGLHMSDV